MQYKIKQLKTRTDYRFMDWDYAKENGFNLDDYEVVYEGELTLNNAVASFPKSKAIIWALEEVFEIFNIRRPEDFKGHSLSMSDVVELDGVNYYCDSFGWPVIE